MNNVLTSFCIQVFVWTNVFISLAYVPGMELLGHVFTPCLTLEELSGCFLK